MEIVVFLVVILLLIPTYIQFRFGVRALCGWTKLKFWQITLLCFLGEFILAIALLFLMVSIEPYTGAYKCGFGLAGITLLGIPIAFLNLFIALIQKISI